MKEDQEDKMDSNAPHKREFIRQAKSLLFTDDEIGKIYDRALSGEAKQHAPVISRDFGPDRINLQLILLRDEQGLPGLSGFRTTLLKIGEIQHTRYQGIDTQELEKKMAAVDWQGSLEEFPAVFDQLALLELSKDKLVSHIAHQLIAKYWIDTSVESYIHMGQYREEFTQCATFHIETESRKKAQNRRHLAGSGQKHSAKKKKGNKPKQ